MQFTNRPTQQRFRGRLATTINQRRMSMGLSPDKTRQLCPVTGSDSVVATSPPAFHTRGTNAACVGRESRRDMSALGHDSQDMLPQQVYFDMAEVSTWPSHNDAVNNGAGYSPVSLPAFFSLQSRLSSRYNLPEPRATTAAPTPHVANALPRVYTDASPSASQPQTPSNLIHMRHGRQTQNPFTAPVHGGQNRRGLGQTSTRRRHPQRMHSPAGLNAPGLEGLYGGLENSDDSVLFLEAERGRNWQVDGHGTPHG